MFYAACNLEHVGVYNNSGASHPGTPKACNTSLAVTKYIALTWCSRIADEFALCIALA
jgi:hypothetical protein